MAAGRRKSENERDERLDEEQAGREREIAKRNNTKSLQDYWSQFTDRVELNFRADVLSCGDH